VALAIAAMLFFGLFTHMACGATYALVPFVDRKALGGVAGIIGAGGNVGAVLAGFLMKGTGDVRQTLSILGGAGAGLGAVRDRARFSSSAAAKNRRRRACQAGSLRNSIMKIIVIGHGMVGHKFLETLAGERRRQPAGHGAVRRAAPGLRPRAPVRILRRPQSPTTCRW
jgi:hypothetical protein